MLKRFFRDDQGSATQWFAVTAVVITLAAVASVQGLSWLAKSGRVPVIAFVPTKDAISAASSGIDMTPIGVIKPMARPRTAP